MQTRKTKLYKVTLSRDNGSYTDIIHVACDEFRDIYRIVDDRGYLENNSIISGTELVTDSLIIEKTNNDGD